MVNRSTSEFLSRISHETCTPLNAVIGFAELLRLRGEYQADHADHILSASQHLLGPIAHTEAVLSAPGQQGLR